MDNKNKKINKSLIVVLMAVLLVFLPSARAVTTASFSFSNQSGSYEVGDNIPVVVYVNSADQSINAISGIISFPADKLSVSSISKTNSIVSLWVQDPTYSNVSGIVNFQGIIFNPGFTGSSGNLIIINFRVKAPGIALVSFASGSILANNGQGTNIIDQNGLPSAQYAIGVPPAAGGNQSIAVSSVSSGPLAPVISSPTHPDQTKWYASNDVKLSWQIPSDVDAARTILSNSSYSIPSVLYQPPINQKELTSLADGIWYFGVQLHDSSGWGGTAYFKFQIDTTPPDSFSFSVASSSDPTNPAPTIFIKATDKTSGIAYYKISVDNQDYLTITPDKLTNYQYKLPVQQPGEHAILAKAFDKAGNYQVASSKFDIQPINSPTITYYTRSLTLNGILLVRGTTSPQTTVFVRLENSDRLSQSFTGVSDQDGNFTVIGTGIDSGNYQLWATATDSRGAQSLPTKKYDVLVSQEFIIIGSSVISWPIALIFLIILFILFYAVISYARSKIFPIKGNNSNIAKFMDKNASRNFEILKKDIKKYNDLIEKPKKTERTTEEEELLWQIKNDLERFEKSIHDILNRS